VVEIEAGAVRVSRQQSASIEALLPEIETGFARINAQLRGLHRTLRTRMAELEAADRHIARLEEKVLKLKQTKRELKQLKAEKHALRKSPERKIGQVILAPYRLPQKLIREVRKQFGGATDEKKRRLRLTNTRKWLQQRRPSAEDLAAAREPAAPFLSSVDQHHHSGLQHPTGLVRRGDRFSSRSRSTRTGS
jgi:chromosome segregation ATPase